MSSGTSVINEIRLKIWPLASHLSRWLKVIGTDTDRSATYDFLLTFHCNHGPISYRFRDKRRLQSKIAIYFHQVRVFCIPAEGVPFGVGYRATGAGGKKNYCLGAGATGRQRSLTISSAIWIQYTNVSDGQTERTDTGQQQRPRLRIASLGKNQWSSTAN